MTDGFGRKITYARISVTDRCNLNCLYCMPQEGSRKNPRSEPLRADEVIAVAQALTGMGIDKIRLTGGEPLLRSDIPRLVGEIARLEGLRDFALTTNGVLLPQYACGLKRLGLRRVNISLDTLDAEKYREITAGGNLAAALDGVKAASDAGLTVKLNTVLINGFNTDEIADIANLTMDSGTDVRFIELMPAGACSAWAAGRYADADAVLAALPTLAPLTPEGGCAAVYYQLPGGKGRVGLIRPISRKFCASCGKIRITADGKVKPCLHSDVEIDIRDKLGDEQSLKQALADAVTAKPYEHELERGKFTARSMTEIGG